jgi:hypothetical protein
MIKSGIMRTHYNYSRPRHNTDIIPEHVALICNNEQIISKVIIIVDYWLERPNPKDSDFSLDHKMAYYSYEKPPEEFQDYDNTNNDGDKNETLTDSYGRSLPAAGEHGWDYQDKFRGMNKYAYQNPAEKKIQLYVGGAAPIIIISSIFNDFLYFFLLFVSSHSVYVFGIILSLFGLFISFSAFVAALYLKRLKHMKGVISIMTIYFIFIILQMILLPIVMTYYRVLPQVVIILLSPVLILGIIGYILTFLSHKYYLQSKKERKEYQQYLSSY